MICQRSTSAVVHIFTKNGYLADVYHEKGRLTREGGKIIVRRGNSDIINHCQ